jgi:molecular chaperone DnaK (HSP70)
MHLRALLNSSLAALGLEGPQVGVVCLVGGPAAMPRLISTVKSVFPAADFPRVRFESSESVCVGAALHGSCLLDKVGCKIVSNCTYSLNEELLYSYF